MKKLTASMTALTPAAAHDEALLSAIRDRITKLSWTIEGPRGGRYRATGPITFNKPVRASDTELWRHLGENMYVLIAERPSLRRVRR